jgi:hypothetical protein
VILSIQQFLATVAIAFLLGWSVALLCVLLGIPRRVEASVARFVNRRVQVRSERPRAREARRPARCVPAPARSPAPAVREGERVH